MDTALAALERLKEGNRRFVNHLRSAEVMMSQLRRGELAKGQNPFAIVLGCSDSRVPAEIVFDQGLGDLFVIRMRPAIEGLVRTDLAKDHGRLIHEAVRANVRASMNQLKHGSSILERMVLDGALHVVGAEYNLESGEVDFFET